MATVSSRILLSVGLGVTKSCSYRAFLQPGLPQHQAGISASQDSIWLIHSGTFGTGGLGAVRLCVRCRAPAQRAVPRSGAATRLPGSGQGCDAHSCRRECVDGSHRCYWISRSGNTLPNLTISALIPALIWLSSRFGRLILVIMRS